MQRFSSVGSVNGTDSERQNLSESHVAKPLPPLPRGWSRVCHETGLLLRSIGLGIVVTAFQGFFTTNFQEPEKIAIRRSRVTALLRTLIHAVPLGMAIFEIVLNSKGRYIGKQFDKQSYVQFAAKAHEISMQASIATILLSYIRFQISSGKGIPFGAVLGGLQFVQVSYLWSSELWSSILSAEFQRRKKFCFVSLMFVCITITATAGPSSANLLIPRQGLWPLGSKYLAVKASFQDIWPDELNGEKVDRDCALIKPGSAFETYHCPLSDFYYMFLHAPTTLFVDAPANDSIEAYFDSLIQGSSYSKSVAMSPCLTSKNQICATAPQTGLLTGFINMSSNNAVQASIIGGFKGLEAYQILQKNYYQPYTASSCIFDVVKDGSDEAPLQFPRIEEINSDLKKDRQIVSISGLTKGQVVNNVSGDNSNFQVHWIELPQDVFGTRIPGAVVVSPQGPNGPPYNIWQCTSDAGWGSSAIANNQEAATLVTSHRIGDAPRIKNQGTFDPYGYIYTSDLYFANKSNAVFPERRISVSKNWMNFLNPLFVLADNSTTSFISRYLSTATAQLEERHVARMFAVLLSIALSNTNIAPEWQVFNDSNTPHTKCDTCLVFELEHSVYGSLYSASGTTIKLAITVMLAYCMLVLGHIIYSIVFGISSSAWDSTAEFVALTMNSSPTEILQNTCAGIVGTTALKTPVRVLATTKGHLELVFGESKGPDVQASTLVMNEKYGKLASEHNNKSEGLDSTGPGELKKRVVARSSE